MKLTHISPHEVKVIAHLVQVLTPCYPELDAMTRAAIQRDVTGFVATQIQLMPSFLRLPYRGALLAFNWVATLRYREPFVSLSNDAATAYISLWSDRGLGMTRDFVKLIRSCALLAYFDHPQVRARLETGPVPPR